MPTKLKSHFLNIRKASSKSTHLYNISNDSFLRNKILIKHRPNDLKKYSGSQTNLLTSKNINHSNPVRLLPNLKRIATEERAQELNNLS